MPRIITLLTSAGQHDFVGGHGPVWPWLKRC